MPEPTLLDVRRAIATLTALAEKRAHVDALDPSVRIALVDAARSALGPAPRGTRRSDARKRAPAKQPQPPAPAPFRVRCSICRRRFTLADDAAARICADCRAVEDTKQRALADVRLDGRIALVTGGRIRLGHRTALSLLRAGARVVVTSRFPHIARARFASTPGIDSGHMERLTVRELDMRRLDDVERCARLLDNELPHLDIVVHNAAQTVRRPAELYAPLVLAERAAKQLAARAPAQQTAAAFASSKNQSLTEGIAGSTARASPSTSASTTVGLRTSTTSTPASCSRCSS